MRTITRLIMRHKMMLLKEQNLQLYKAIMGESVGDGGAGISREDLSF